MADPIHPVYLPITANQLLEHFAEVAGTGLNSERHLKHYRASAAARAAMDVAPPSGLPREAARSIRLGRQMEKDERFWVCSALMTVFRQPDRISSLERMLRRCLGDIPPFEGPSTWTAALGAAPQLFFEVNLPSPPKYREWLRDHLDERVLVPYLKEAAATRGTRLEGATKVDAMLISPDTGFAVLFEAKGPPVFDGGPGVLYVFWRDFGSGRNRMAKSIDGGLTFSLPTTVNTYRESPSPFPGSGFRNGNIPAGVVDPDDPNTVYLSYMDYHATNPDGDCPEAGDDPIPGQVCDADVMLIKSTDGGRTWGNPTRVNQDPVGNGKDQFQQQLAITQSGQLNMMWFDRRNDLANFYIDTFFGRSNDRGQTWTETRVTKSMWDPSINPLMSGSGEFIGDYQGLIATDPGGVPFWNDTSLAQLSGNHPRYSPYQEAFSARIPNTAEFGGP